jgi:hypothetical protein
VYHVAEPIIHLQEETRQEREREERARLEAVQQEQIRQNILTISTTI